MYLYNVANGTYAMKEKDQITNACKKHHCNIWSLQGQFLDCQIILKFVTLFNGIASYIFL